MSLGRNIISLAGGISDDVVSRAVRQLEERIRDLLGHVHALATRTATGFMPRLSGTATEYLDGTGNWSTPAGGGGGGGVPTSRTISTTAPLTGGGDLSADRTLAVSTFTSGASGIVPASGGGTTNFLRADGSWSAPGGGGGGLTVPQTLALASLRP